MAALAALVLLAAPATTALAQATVVLVVRHAERSPGTGDVPISEAGHARARALADLASAAGVQAVIHTQFQRTRQTAEPFLAAAGVSATVVSTQSDIGAHSRDVAAAVRQHAGKTVLVVGHSNTVPAIVAALGGTRYPDLCDAEYDALFTVILADDGAVRTIRSRFGAATPPGPECATMRGSLE
ncbi:MAG: histidine phosphatase family protein [Gemmatimonadaceae bacterium]|nr:histidine phosphatase family protein [Gemmatimonadaceae bacterium]